MRSHGLAMRLIVPRRRYPRDALIRVTLTVTNVSQHAISLESGLNAPVAFVLDSSGAAVFDPRNPLGNSALIDVTGPGPRYESLLKGQTVTTHDYLVLLGDRITFSVQLGKPGRPSGPTIIGRPVTVALVDRSAPAISISTTSTLQAVVTPSGPVSGSLFYEGETSCVTSDGTYSTGGSWTTTKTNVITPTFDEGSSDSPDCAGSRIWHALVGWLNHPVAVLSYEDVESTENSLFTSG